MLKYFTAYIASAIVFVAMDVTWLTFASARLYRPVIGDLLASKVAIAPGVAFYVLYLAGVMILAVAPALKSGSWAHAALSAAVLGLVAYGTYDLTNQATLRSWSTRLTLADMGWGAVATTVAALAGFAAARALGADRT